MPPRRRRPPAAVKREADDAASVHSVDDSSPEPAGKQGATDTRSNGHAVTSRPQRWVSTRTRSGGSRVAPEAAIYDAIDDEAVSKESSGTGRPRRRVVLKNTKPKKEDIVAPVDISSDEAQPEHTRRGHTPNVEDIRPKTDDEDIEGHLEEVEIQDGARESHSSEARAMELSPVHTDAPVNEDFSAEELEMEQVDVSAGQSVTGGDGDHDDDDAMDLEQVDVTSDSAQDVDANVYAAAYEAARANAENTGQDVPVFKDGKGQPGGINISLQASSHRSNKASASTSKRGAVVTTHDRMTRLATHKLMALAILAHTRIRNELLNNDQIRDDLYAVMPNGYLEKLRAIHPKKVPNLNERIRQFEIFMRELTKWWSYKFRLDPQLTALGALRQPDADLLAGQFPRPGRRVDGWTVESARERQDREREVRRQAEERRKARSPGRSAKATSSKAKERKGGQKRANGEEHKPGPQPPFPNITLFGPSNSTTPVYMRLAEPRESTRTIQDLLLRIHSMNGSREHSAQLFAALCRALGIPSRLVVSIQVPSWSISASKVASTTGTVPTPTKGGALAKKRKSHHEESSLRRREQNAVRRRYDSDYITSEAESFQDTPDGHTSDEFRGPVKKVQKKNGGRSAASSKPVSVASTTPEKSDAEHSVEPSSRRSMRRAALTKGARKAVAEADQAKEDPPGGAESDTTGKKRDGDYRGEKWRGLKTPLQVQYKPKLRAQKPKPLKDTELAADAQPDIPPVDVLAPPVMWVEVYSKPWQRWITVDPVRGLVEPTGNRQMEPLPSDKSNRLVYVVAFEEDGFARDVTARYTRTLHSRVSRMRPPPSKRNASSEAVEWWSRVVTAIHRPQKLDRDAAEDLELEGAASREPMPTSVAAFKDHPVYAIEKHLKRDEVIHPYKQAGTFQGMPVFLRAHVIGVKSARQWYNEGRVVKEGDEALKWVKSRGYTLANKRAEEEARQQGLDGLQEGLYALFQTTLYEPPPVVDGHVPTNSFGNIDLFVDSMLPAGAAHIPYNGTVKIAKKLGVHYAEAITGFEFRKHRSMPRLTGIVVAEENRDAVLQAYWVSESMQAEREVQRRQERLFKNWKRLLNALKIQDRLQREYGTNKAPLVAEADSTSAMGQVDALDRKSDRRKKRVSGREEGATSDDGRQAYESLHAAGYTEDGGSDAEGGGFIV